MKRFLSLAAVKKISMKKQYKMIKIKSDLQLLFVTTSITNVGSKMKQISLGLSLMVLFLPFNLTNVFGQSGIYESYAILNINGGGNTFYDMAATTGNPDFQGANLGNFTASNTLVLNGGQNKTFKCGGCNIINSSIWYRVYPTATPSGSFSQSGYFFASNDAGGCGGNQTWQATASNINLLSGLSAGNYTIEVYSTADFDGCGTGTNFSSNLGANYRATFNYCGPTSGALPAGTYNIPGCFATINAAATYVNTNGISGPVVFEVNSGHSETAPIKGIPIGSATLNPTLSATNTLTFRKIGAGVATVNAGVGTANGPAASPDGMLYLNGADFVTIDGITFTDGNTTNATVAMEFGVAFFKFAAGNGCNNNTIQNCIFNMQRINNTGGAGPMGDGSIAIQVLNSTAIAATTALTPTNGGTLATNGTNSNNRFYANTINNGNAGIYLSGFAATVGVGPTPTATTFLGDINNDIGGTALATGNSILNFGGGAATNPAVGIRANNQWSVNIRFNTINNNNGSGVNHATTLRGIFAQAGTSANATINDNIVTVRSGATTSGLNAIENGIGSTAASNTININNNTIRFSYTTATTGIFSAIVNSSTAASVNISTNNIQQIASTNYPSTGTIPVIVGGSPNGTLNVTNNTISNFNMTGASGTLRAITANTPVGLYTCTGNTIENLSYATVGSSGSIDGIYNLSSATQQNWNSNIIRNLSTPTAGTITGIRNNTVTGTFQFNNNQIYNFSTTAGGAGGGTFIGIASIRGVATISGNIIYALNSTGSTGGTGGIIYGISVTTLLSDHTITNNAIYNLSSNSTNVTVAGINIGGGVTNNVSNNLIGDLRAPNSTGNTSISGILVSAGTTNNIFHNTVNIAATTSSATTFGTSAIYISSATPVNNLRNNIFVNTSASGPTGGYAAALRRSTAPTATNFPATNNNNLYFAGAPSATKLLYGEGTGATATNGQQTLVNYKTYIATTLPVAGREAASVSENPLFASTTGSNPITTFLQYATGTSLQLEQGGALGTGISTDYASTTRCPGGGCPGAASTPDIGAWELNGTPLDMIAPTISYTAIPNSGCAATGATLSATITDASGVNVTAGTKPRLYYKLSTETNGFAATNTSAANGWKFVEATNAASPFTFAMDYSLLTSTPTSGNTIQYFVVAQDNVATPNVGINSGTFAAAPASVALTSAAFAVGGTINSFNISNTIPTSVTIGATGTYTSITGATGSLFAAINAGGLSGNTVATIIDASVTETGATALNQISYGCTPNVTLTIKPQTTATLTGSFSGGLIVLNGADYVTIDGSNNGTSTRDLTISNTNGGTSSAVVWLQSAGTNGATNNVVKNCNIAGNTPITTLVGLGSGSSTIGAASLGTNNNNNTFLNNNISRVQYAIYSQGQSLANKNTGNIIQSNLINTASPNQVSKSGILVGFENNILISGNNISNISGVSSADAWAINLGAITTFTTTPPTVGNEVTNATVSSNLIGSIRAASTYSVAGILVSPSTSGINLIANNMISDVATNGILGSCGIGIMVAGGSGSTTRVYHNSVSMSATLTGGSTPNIALAVSNNPVIDIKNNLLASTGSTGSGPNRAIALSYSTYTNLTSNNNDLFVSGGGATAGVAAIGGWAGTAQVTLSDWQTTTSKDANSVNVNPNFISASDLHLVIGSNSTLNNSGATGTGITVDIDGDVRCPGGGCPGATANPDMGADEFSPPQDDAGVISFGSASFCPGTQTVQATVQNFGAVTLNTFSVTWSVNGTPQGTVAFTGQNIASGATGVVTLGTFSFVAATNYTLVASTSLPNGNTDANATNDQFTSPTFQTGLSGTYTVGVSGNYPTLTAAVAAANAYGLCGPTVFSLTDATYSGSETFPITINQLSGSSTTNTLTIVPATGVTSAITGTNAAAIIKLNGADNIIIDGSNNGSTTRNLTIANTSANTSSTVVWLASIAAPANGATNNVIKNCTVTGNTPATTFCGILVSGSAAGSAAEIANSNNLIQNNLITASYYGIGLSGFASGETNNVVQNNTIGSTVAGSKIGFQGLFIANQIGVNVSSNTVLGITASINGNVAGIYLTGNNNGGTISKNIISDVKNTIAAGRQSMGIFLDPITTTGNLTISNNMIFDIANSGNNATLLRGAHGIYIATGSGYRLYHNSVNINTNPTGGFVLGNNAALYVAAAVTNLDVRNNIFANTQTTAVNRFAIYADAPNTSFTTIDNNDYFSSGTNLGFIGSARTLLADLVTGFGGNANSVSSAPNFTSATDLHLVAGTNPTLNNVGATGTGIADDIDGDVRCPGGGCPGTTTNPDMGADEFNPPTDDAGVISFGGSNFCTGTQTVQATVQNYGAVTLNTFSVTWSVNGTSQGTVAFTAQNIAAGATGVVTLGTFNFLDATNYTLVASTSLPNGNTDANATNDQFTTPTFQTGLSGTYTVGASGNYPTLTAAVAAANANGLCGPTVFSLTDATYSGSETFPITINQLVGSSSTNTLTISPATGVTASIFGSSASALIRLNGADNIIIDGSNSGGTTRNLTITNTATTTGIAAIANISLGTGLGATNNTIKNCLISTGNTTTNPSYGIHVGGATNGTVGADNDNVTIQNNAFSVSTVGIYANGTAATTAGGIDNLNVTGNSVVVNTSAIIVYGIQVGNALTSSITSNTIDVRTSGAVSPVGISIEGGVSGTIISKNNITRVLATNTGGYGGRGITVGTGSSTSNITVSNNMISGINGSNYSAFGNSSSMGIAVGIIGNSTTLTTTCGGINIYHNTINLSGSYTYAANCITAPLYVGSGASDLNVRNNIFVNTLNNTNGAGTASKNYAIYSVAASSAFTALDNNNYSVAATAQGILGFIGSDMATIAAIQSGFGGNINSSNIVPNFTSASDLHLVAGTNPSLNNTGATGTGISDDIDGDVRCPAGGCPGATTNPDMGADEFNPPQDDAGVVSFANTTFCPGSQSIQVTVQNLGIATLTSFDVTWSINGTSQGTVNFTGQSIAAGATAVVTLGTFTLVTATNYTFVAATSLPNGNVDANTANDQFTTPTFQTGLSGTYTVGASGNFPTLTAAVAAANTNGLCGPTVFSLTDATYSGSETFPITINQLVGSSTTNTLTIVPASGVNAAISGSSTSAIIRLNGADNIIIEGSNNGTTTRNLTIANTNTGTSSAVVWITTVASPADGANNDIVRNTVINGNAPLTTFGGIVLSAPTIGNAGVTPSNDLTVQNNVLSSAQYGVVIVGATGGQNNTTITQNVIGNATDATTIGFVGIFGSNLNNSSISNNTITNIKGATSATGITLAANATNSSILSNTINGINAGSSFAYGLNVGTGSNNLVIRNNTITNASSSSTGANAWGIRVGDVGTAVTVSNLTIDKNIITNIAGAATGGYGGKGIDVNAVSATSNISISNNMIAGIQGSGWNGAASSDLIVGIRLSGSTGGVNIYHNTVALNTGTFAGSASGTLSSALHLSSTTITNINLRNNIFFTNLQNSGAAAAKTYSIYSASPNTAFTTIDNNDYFTSGTQGVLGFLGSDLVALGDIVTGFGSNVNSLSVIPNFVSATDLHLVTGTNLTLDNAGALGTAITDDIDGDVRCPGGGCPGATTKPDIGADEFFVPPLDMAATALVSPAASTQCFTNAETVTVTIQNLSGNTIDFSVDNVTVNVNVTGAVTQSLSAILSTGTLAAGATQNVNMSTTLDMTTLGVYTFNAATVVTGDGVPANNALGTAVTRTVAAPVAGTISASITSYCVTGGTPTLTLTGSSGGNIQWQESTTSNVGPWTNVGAGATTFTPVAAVTATTYYQAVVSCNVSSVTATAITVALNNPLVTSTTPDTVCVSGPVTLSAVGSAGTTLNWYATASSSTSLGTGTSFTTPSLTSSTNYFVEASSGTTVLNMNPPNFLYGGAVSALTAPSNSYYMIFNATESTSLTSVTVYATAAGVLNLQLTNSAGTVLQTATYTITALEANSTTGALGTPIVVPLNFSIPAGTGYRLGIATGTTCAILRNTSGATTYYNQNVGGIVFTGNWFADNAYWYFFYNIVVTNSCKSPRIQVRATVNPNPNAFTVTSTAATTCENAVNTLTASTVANPAYVLGTATASSVAANTPYRQAVSLANQSRVQYLITAAELNAVGISGAVNLNSLGFNVTTAGSGTMANYTISMANTSLTALTATYQAPTFTTVYSGTSILPVLGLNSYTFTTPFAWDGTSNIIVNICHQGTGGTASVVEAFTPSANMTTSGAGNNQCNLTSGGAVNANKPVMYITTAVNCPISWTTNVTGLFSDAAATIPYVDADQGTVYSKPSSIGSYTYTATADYFGCTTTSPITVVVNPKPTATVTSTSTSLCYGNDFAVTGNITASGAWTLTLSNGATVTGTGNGSWTSTVVPSTTTTYSVTNIVDALACPVGTLTGNTVLTLPTVTAALAPTDNASCVVKGTNWTHFYTSAGKLVVSIKANNPTDDLGVVTASAYVNADAQVTSACADPAATTFKTAVMGRNWYINPTNNLPATIRLPITNAEVAALVAKSATTTVNPNDDVFAIGDVNLSKYNGLNENGSWEDNCNPADSTSYATSNLYITQGGNGAISIANGFVETIAGSSYIEFTIPGFSEFWLMNSENATPLPVQLTNFNASCNLNEVNVKWTTASEQNSQSFIVERSRDLAIWEFVSEIGAAGNSSSDLNYTVSDLDPIAGVSYYRLKQVDLDGAEKIYGPISVACFENENSMIVFPNPTKGNFTVEISSSENISNAQIQVTDLTGKVINERTTNILEGKSQFTFEGLDLQLGTYIINLNTGNGKINPVRVVVN
jgi:hypothetical protein